MKKMFKIGDRVRIIKNGIEDNGRLGTVCNVFNDDWYGVLIDYDEHIENKLYVTLFMEKDLTNCEIPPNEKDMWRFHEWMEKYSPKTTEQPAPDNGKPEPFSLTPRAEWSLNRAQQLAEAIKYHAEYLLAIPIEWVYEWNEFVKYADDLIEKEGE